MRSGILIADDSAAVRRVVKEHLTRLDLPICGEAEDGEDTIEKAEALKPDLIVLDLAMPRVNGYVAAQVLKSLLPGVRIILFTMYSDALGKKFGATGVPVDAVVAKSDGIRRLTDCVQRLLKAEPKQALAN